MYIRPRLSGRLLPMSLIVFAYLVGPPLFGWYGIFYGPLLLVVVFLFCRLKLPSMLHPEAGMPRPSDLPRRNRAARRDPSTTETTRAVVRNRPTRRPRTDPGVAAVAVSGEWRAPRATAPWDVSSVPDLVNARGYVTHR
ncbi:hypothetical protein ACFQRB_20265 [Halobaculum litoreum]|uniref:Uncharacterized protein n=1 Tax=Halobaculum litoreum TaxID=3031998 RepID=A0ABD5XXB9_9EURY